MTAFIDLIRRHIEGDDSTPGTIERVDFAGAVAILTFFALLFIL